jgi:hypothetical protein
MIAAGKFSPSLASLVATMACVWVFSTGSAITPPKARAAGAAPIAPKSKSEAGSEPRKPAAKTSSRKGANQDRAPKAQTPKPEAKRLETPPPAEAPRKLPPLAPIDTSTPPPMLPRASRERMHACAEEWQKVKRTTQGDFPVWKSFATRCLTR